DLLMPEMDGFAFLAELQRRGQGRSVPVVVLTAKDLTADDHQRLGGPVEKILRKGSLGHEQLLAEVSALMAGCDRRKRGGGSRRGTFQQGGCTCPRHFWSRTARRTGTAWRGTCGGRAMRSSSRSMGGRGWT